MRTLIIVCAAVFLTLTFVSRAHAQSASPTPAPAPSIQWTNEFSVQNEPSSVITLLKNFIQGFDSLLGGFIFYTPDPLANTITLKDGSEIPGVTKYRDIFYQIAIPLIAIIIAGVAIMKLGSDNTQELKAFGLRFFIVIALYLTVPLVLSYSIQFNNLLVNKISETQQFTGFLNNYFDKSQEKITSGDSSESFGIPSFDISLKSGVFKSLGKFIVQIFLFALTFLFLLFGFLYLGFQFVIRFATLLFLGVLYPIVLPFALAERTQGIVHTYFRTWFTFLIQQPAFVLGFAIATDIFNSILTAKGPSVGMLFFYTGFLFFLGGVNMLVAKIFGDAWTAASSNMIAAISSRAVTSPLTGSFGDFKKGLIGGSVSNMLGRQIKSWATPKKNLTEADTNGKGSGNNGQQPYASVPSTDRQSVRGNKETPEAPPFSQALVGKGLAVESMNPRQGVVAVTGEAYKYEDKRSGLTSYYPTQLEAIQDGAPENKLERVELNQEQFIDLSSFGKHNPNPHNFNAMQEAKSKGKGIDYAFVNKTSPPQKIKHFLELSKSRNEAYGIQGVIVERQAKQGSDPVIRMYSHKSYEKRKNI